MLRKVVLVLVIIILCTPLLRTIERFFSGIKFESTLAGTFVEPNPPRFSIKTILNGTFQNDFERFFNYNMVGRPTMTRIHNQILYSFFNSINSEMIMIGKDNYLFEVAYANAYLNEPDNDKKNELFDKLSSLALLQQKIEEMGKRLFVVITPSKVSINPECLPNAFTRYMSMKNSGKYSQNYYEYFVSKVNETGLKYFDFHDEFLELKNNGTDIFTKSGTHYTGHVTAPYFSELINVLNESSENKIGTIQTIRAMPVWGNAFFTDDDLERLLNLFPAYTSLPKRTQKVFPFYKHIFPRAHFYSYHMESLSVPTDYQPSVFLCGGSFSSSWICLVYGIGWVNHGDIPIFSSVEFSWYNSFVTKFPEGTRISDATDDFYSVLDKDIIIIEFNEQAMDPDSPQFAFVENLLDFIEKEIN